MKAASNEFLDVGVILQVSVLLLLNNRSLSFVSANLIKPGVTVEPHYDPTSTTGASTTIPHLLEPPLLPGVMPGVDRPKIILAQDIDYPPFAELGPAAEDFPVSGFGAKFAVGLEQVCDIDMIVVQTQWDNCWTGDTIGRGLVRTTVLDRCVMLSMALT